MGALVWLKHLTHDSTTQAGHIMSVIVINKQIEEHFIEILAIFMLKRH